MDFKLGDILRHKATHKRCVVRELDPEGYVVVTTQDDEVKSYKPDELEPYKGGSSVKDY